MLRCLFYTCGGKLIASHLCAVILKLNEYTSMLFGWPEQSIPGVGVRVGIGVGVCKMLKFLRESFSCNGQGLDMQVILSL